MASGKFDVPREGAGWALEAVDELHDALRKFFASDIADMIDEVDATTGETVRKVKFKGKIPGTIRRKATDAIVTAKHSFDQAAYAAHTSLHPTSSPKHLYFPWGDSLAHFQGRLKQYDERLWPAYASLKPYPGGPDYEGGDSVLRAIAMIANDKHSVGLRVEGSFRSIKYPSICAYGLTSLRMGSCRGWDQEANEIEIMRWSGGTPQIAPTFELGYHMLLNDERLPNPVDVVPALRAFGTMAMSACDTLEARCKKLMA